MIERDVETLTEKLEKWGKGRRQNFGQGSAKRKVMRWDWNDHSFLVSIAEGEFVSLSIEKSEVADRRGNSQKLLTCTFAGCMKQMLKKEITVMW